MDRDEPLKRETEALIAAIWGPVAAEQPVPIDPAIRTEQNRALAVAMRAYLLSYLRHL